MNATKTYQVADGVAWVNGKAVPEDRKVDLSDAEAAFDLAHGRIALAPVRDEGAADVPRGRRAGGRAD